MFVYDGVNYTATVKGSTPVAVRCEKCGHKYYYLLVCTAVGRGQAPYGLGAEAAKERARAAAERQLRRMLETEIVPVPCPQCGWYQEEMIPQLKAPRLRWMRFVGISGVVVGGLVAVVATLLTAASGERHSTIEPAAVVVAWGVTAITLLGGIALLLVRRHKNAGYDPNNPETEQERIELGRRFTITKEEAEELMQDQED